MDNKENICLKCGTKLQDGQKFCPECGEKVDLKDIESNNFSDNSIKRNNKKAITFAVVGGVLIAGVALAYTFLKPTTVEEIILSKDSIELKKDDTQSISYTISPQKAADAKVTWTSSNESVATVDKDGEIKAMGDGACTITVSAGGKSDTISVIVKTGPDFSKIFDDCELDTEWAKIGYDGSYLTIDTNPDDEDDYTNYAAYLSIYAVNLELGLPDSLTEKMGQTSALDGRQTQIYDDVTVSWKYHPNQGLEVTYEAN